ncbi:MAG: carboxyl-terminal protease family protein, partial [Bacteriovoracaceae bacterium]|nr:carboxyl-terminal protease family protein [Bacteriovoracaceae bacterium]
NKIFVDDRILSIDGHSVRGLNEMEVRQRIRGDRGTRVAFVGKRAGKAFTTILTRDIVHQRSVESSWLDNQVLVIKIHRFFRQTAQEVERIVETDGLKAKGFILDLRNNPGGLLQGARDVVDLFVSQGVVVYLKGRGVEDQVWALREGGELKKPIVVLINGLTASAAEIVAGALQDYGRAILVGQKTYGKGSVQNIYETQSAVGTQYRGGLKLTTLWYYLPSGRSVKSLDPDIKIASHDEAEFVHPMMPYSGASRIPVKQVADFGKAHFDKRASSLIERFQDTQEAGKALLLKMLAGNQARALSDQ